MYIRSSFSFLVPKRKRKITSFFLYFMWGEQVTLKDRTTEHGFVHFPCFVSEVQVARVTEKKFEKWFSSCLVWECRLQEWLKRKSNWPWHHQVFMFVCLFVCMHVWITHACMYTCMCACVRVWTYVFTHGCVHVYMYEHIFIHVCIYMNLYICIYMYIYKFLKMAVSMEWECSR